MSEKSWNDIPHTRKIDFVKLLIMEAEGGGWIDPDLWEEDEEEAEAQTDTIQAVIDLLYQQTPGLREAVEGSGDYHDVEPPRARLVSVPSRNEMWEAARKVYGDKIYNAMRSAPHGESPRIWEAAALEAFTRGETGTHVETLRAGLKVLRETGALQ